MTNIGTKFILADRFTFDPISNSLIDKENNDENTRLGSNESRILWLLAQRPNDVISRNELHDFVWREQGFEVDDSSLTQAISTLRKMLKDSTKSPEYVKTVPKRGYQLIARVEAVEQTLLEEQDLTLPAVGSESFELSHDNKCDTAMNTPADLSASSQSSSPNWLSPLIIVMAIILPLLAWLLHTPTTSPLKPLLVMDDITVNTPINHPDLTAWIPSIELCIKKYNTKHIGEPKPSQVIATGGQNNQLTLNFIHATENSAQNISLRIVANLEDSVKVCE